MDTNEITAPELARVLGVSLPSAHRIFDNAGVPAMGRGNRRLAPRSVLAEHISSKGSVPTAVAHYSPSQLRVLAALTRSPLGLRSARQVATTAGVSPTVASRELGRLAELGLVARKTHTVAAATAKRIDFWEAIRTSRAWTPSLTEGVRAVTLPKRERIRATRLPDSLLHHFWNADTAQLDVKRDASYIAERLLTSKDVSAWNWALSNLPEGDVSKAMSRRGVDAPTRAIVENWRNHELSSIDAS